MATAYVPTSYHGWADRRAMQDEVVITGSFTTTSLLVNDTWKFFEIPAKFWLIRVGFIIPDMDTNGTPLLSWDLGDSSSATLFLSADTTGQAAGQKTTVSHMPKYYSAVDYLILKAHHAAATAANGTIKFAVTLASDVRSSILN